MMNGKLLRDAIISAANNIANHKKKVDALNVFPVPDGDTGTNMSMTMSAAKRELEAMPDEATVSEVAKTASSALLRGARGNSGVITSLLFRGFSKGLRDKVTAGAEDVAEALSLGVEAAYKAVMKPTEGTILTVARVSSETVKEEGHRGEEITAMWNSMLASAKEALASTPELLPVLKKAGVVDAGGQGLVHIYEGMKSVFDGNGIIQPIQEDAEGPIHVDTNAAGEFEGEITFTYCTEFIVIRDQEHLREAGELRVYLESIGDCVVVVDDEEIIKCHVHTNDPGLALQKALTFGMLTKLKIENMRLQYAEQLKAREEKALQKAEVDHDIPYGFVSVAAGNGIISLFKDLGVNHVVSGGQTMNPSTDDILHAVEATPAETVFVLPNNKNIIMAAEQAAKLVRDRKVVVLPTRTIPQGLSAMLAFDPESDAEQNAIAMNAAAEHVATGQITFAARDSDFDGNKIKQGELLAMHNGKITFVEHELKKCAVRLTKSMLTRDSAFVTAIYGSDVSEEQAHEIEEAIREKLPRDIEFSMIPGGQPVYYFIISVE